MASDQAGENSVMLSQFYVIPTCIGSTVLKTLLNEAETQNKPITLSVVKFNPAVRFYERHGFHITHEDEFKFYMTSKR